VATDKPRASIAVNDDTLPPRGGAAPVVRSMRDKTVLRLLFGFILISLLLFTSFASTQQPVWEWSGLTQGENRWWTAATLMDAYYGFITFFVWVCYKERRWVPRIGWFIAIMLLGNMAMASYVLLQLARLRSDQPASVILTVRNY
jgi:hypothetical protein